MKKKKFFLIENIRVASLKVVKSKFLSIRSIIYIYLEVHATCLKAKFHFHLTNMVLKIHSPLMNESNSARRSNFYDSSRSFKLKDISKEFEQ